MTGLTPHKTPLWATRPRQEYNTDFSFWYGQSGCATVIIEDSGGFRMFACMLLAGTVWQHIWEMGAPLGEKILRPVIVYIFLVLLLRIFGKRELAQLNPFDLVVLLSLSNTVQNAIIGDDNSVSGG